MGGTFRAPKVQQRVIPVVDTEAEAKKRAEKQKQETLERQRRGQESTIKTSYSGILGEKENNLKRKNLLGE